MAYPIIDGPYGLKPVNLIGGQVFAGSTREIPIQYGSSVSIFAGDFVRVVRGNAMRQAVTTDGTAAGMVGVFLGCSYTSPVTNQKIFSTYWPGGTLAGDAVAIVCDDPDTVFKAVVCSATTVVASGSFAMIGQNYSMIDNTGVALSGNGVSRNALLYSATLTTAAFPMRVVGMVPETAVPVSATGSSSSTTITLTGTGLPSSILAGTDVAYIAGGTSPNGQIVRTGSFVTTAASAGATSVTINAATTSLGNTATTIPSGSTIVFTQYPEMLVKINFANHSYYTATAV
jgi:hypothetical protein